MTPPTPNHRKPNVHQTPRSRDESNGRARGTEHEVEFALTRAALRRERQREGTTATGRVARVSDGPSGDHIAIRILGDHPVVPTRRNYVQPTQKPTPQRWITRRIDQKLLRIGTLAVAGAFAVGMTIPAVDREGLERTSAAQSSAAVTEENELEDEIQAFVAPRDTRAEELDRETQFTVVTVADLAAAAGIRHFTGSLPTDSDAALRWPFPVGVPTSSSFGPRDGRMHVGADFTPGSGAEIQAIADGVVRIATEQGGAFGVTVYIEHVIDGRSVFSRYAHMQYGSLNVREGERVTAGRKVGLVGNTGRSFGAHLHLEITDGEEKIDPVAWLQEKTS
ncbi:MAG: M23 family metallopeptidase [Microbacterium sp.]